MRGGLSCVKRRPPAWWWPLHGKLRSCAPAGRAEARREKALNCRQEGARRQPGAGARAHSRSHSFEVARSARRRTAGWSCARVPGVRAAREAARRIGGQRGDGFDVAGFVLAHQLIHPHWRSRLAPTRCAKVRRPASPPARPSQRLAGGGAGIARQVSRDIGAGQAREVLLQRQAARSTGAQGRCRAPTAAASSDSRTLAFHSSSHSTACGIRCSSSHQRSEYGLRDLERLVEAAQHDGVAGQARGSTRRGGRPRAQGVVGLVAVRQLRDLLAEVRRVGQRRDVMGRPPRSR